MINRRTGLVAGVALAVGLAIGTVGSATAADPTASPGFGPMMGGGGMMGGASFRPGATFGPGMMGGITEDQRQQTLEWCDRMHDALHGSASPSSGPSPR